MEVWAYVTLATSPLTCSNSYHSFSTLMTAQNIDVLVVVVNTTTWAGTGSVGLGASLRIKE